MRAGDDGRCDVIEVFFRCRRQVAEAAIPRPQRDQARRTLRRRRSAEEIWNEENAQPIAGGWPVVEVDTNASVAIEAVLARITGTSSTGSADHSS